MSGIITICSSCGHESGDVYRCTECGKNLTDEGQASGRQQDV